MQYILCTGTEIGAIISVYLIIYEISLFNFYTAPVRIFLSLNVF